MTKIYIDDAALMWAARYESNQCDIHEAINRTRHVAMSQWGWSKEKAHTHITAEYLLWILDMAEEEVVNS
jgi:hypothetical protein